MAKYIQIVFPSFWWDSGNFDSSNNPIYVIIDTAALVAACGASIVGGFVMLPQGTSYVASGQLDTFVVQAVTNDLPALKAGVNAYLASISAPAANYPSYPFAVDVTVNP